MKLLDWIETGTVRVVDGQPVIDVRIRTDRRSFWAEVWRTAWDEYGAFWWFPPFWLACLRIAWRYVRAS